MKRISRSGILLLLLFLIAFAQSYNAYACPGFSRNNWRWRNNDGSETSATWKANQNASTFYSGGGNIIRLRVEVVNTTRVSDVYGQSCAVPAEGTIRDTLQYSTTPSVESSWTIIDNSTVNGFMLAGPASTYVLQGEQTTPQLTNSLTGYAFTPGSMMTSSSGITQTFPALTRSEFEWAIMGTANMLTGTTFYFRQKRAFLLTNTPPVYPTLTTAVASPLPVRLTRFFVKKEGSKVRVEWTTASEENSSHFEVQRSADGQAWQTITQVQSRGNATSLTNYLAYDERPLPALNYYRLKQVDKDGQFSLSDIKSLRLLSDGVVSVWPNPASSFINFSLKDAETKVTATLQDATGRQVQRQVFNNLQPGAVSQLAMAQKPPAGVYVLKLESDGFSETRKIIIQ